jgi:hypothetical protein
MSPKSKALTCVEEEDETEAEGCNVVEAERQAVPASGNRDARRYISHLIPPVGGAFRNAHRIWRVFVQRKEVVKVSKYGQKGATEAAELCSE